LSYQVVDGSSIPDGFLFSGDGSLFPELPAGIPIPESKRKLLESFSDNASSVQHDDRHFHWQLANSAKQLSKNNIEGAIQAYENAKDVYREVFLKRKNTIAIFNTEFEKFSFLALLASGDKAQIAVANKALKSVDHDIDHLILQAYGETLTTGVFNFTTPLLALETFSMSVIYYSLIKHWLGQDLSDGVTEILEAKYEKAKAGNYQWLQAEYAHALGLFSDDIDDKTRYQK
jgi:hypothetical protein